MAYCNSHLKKFADKVVKEKRDMHELFYPQVSLEASEAFTNIITDNFTYEGLDLNFCFISMKYDDHICETLQFHHFYDSTFFSEEFISNILRAFFHKDAVLCKVINHKINHNIWVTFLDLDYNPLENVQDFEVNVIGDSTIDGRDILLITP